MARPDVPAANGNVQPGTNEFLARILQKIKLGNIFAEKIVFCFVLVTMQALS